MKVNEIRIGNYHYYHIVDPLDERGEYDEVCQIDADDFRVLTEFVCPEYKPILLTEEWLLKFGCEKAKRGFVIDRFRLTYNEKYKFWYVVDDSTLSYITKVEFVHEWQNVYFVLNGTELTIKTNKP